MVATTLTCPCCQKQSQQRQLLASVLTLHVEALSAAPPWGWRSPPAAQTRLQRRNWTFLIHFYQPPHCALGVTGPQLSSLHRTWTPQVSLLICALRISASNTVYGRNTENELLPSKKAKPFEDLKSRYPLPVSQLSRKLTSIVTSCLTCNWCLFKFSWSRNTLSQGQISIFWVKIRWQG